MNQLLASLGDGGVAALRPHLTEVDLHKGQILCEAHDPVEHVYFPRHGMISTVIVMEEGDSAECSTVGNEGGFGLLSALAQKPCVPMAVCQIPGPAYRMEAGVFRRAAGESMGLRDAVTRHGDMLLSQTQQHAACNLLHGLERRLARWTMNCLDHVQGNELFLTQEFLGQMLGVRRTTVTEVARSLQTLGLIRYSRGRITVLDRGALEEHACECRAMLKGIYRDLWPSEPKLN